jgi:catechol 2,3-dioxygenase-like lactoylglutathione lyase family enzyme
MTTAIAGIAHVNLRASAATIEALRVFYRDVIGLEDGPRPAFRSRGYWLYAGAVDVLHLSVDESAASSPLAATGAFNHIAFAAIDIDATRLRLDGAGVDYTFDGVPASGEAQIFLRDPAGVGVELNFRA